MAALVCFVLATVFALLAAFGANTLLSIQVWTLPLAVAFMALGLAIDSLGAVRRAS